MRLVPKATVAGAVMAIALLLPTTGADAKGGWSWHVHDRDGFLRTGQTIRAQGVFPASKEPLPRFALVIPNWDWNAQPRRVPDDAIQVGELTLTRYRLRGNAMVRADVTFEAPGAPGEYVLATCAEPCYRFSFPGPTPVIVVSGLLESRLLKELRERDTEIQEMSYRITRVRARANGLEKAVTTQLSYLSQHTTRIAALERALEAKNPGQRAALPGVPVAVALGGAAGFALARLRLRRNY